MGAGANLTLNEMVQVLNLTGDLEAQFGGRLMINSGRYEKLMDRLQSDLEEKEYQNEKHLGSNLFQVNKKNKVTKVMSTFRVC